MKLVCVDCESKFDLVEVGTNVLEKNFNGTDYLYSADIYSCPDCKQQVAVLANQPFLKSTDEDFKEIVEVLKGEGHLIEI